MGEEDTLAVLSADGDVIAHAQQAFVGVQSVEPQESSNAGIAAAARRQIVEGRQLAQPGAVGLAVQDVQRQIAAGLERREVLDRSPKLAHAGSG